MKKLFTHIRNAHNLITGKKPEPVIEKVPVVITSYSQPHVLQQRMKEESLTHDQKVLANMSPVRLESNFGKMVLYFCPMYALEVTKHLKDGDGRPIPEEVQLNELSVPKDIQPGLYKLHDVELHSNGVMSVTSTPKTKWERI